MRISPLPLVALLVVLLAGIGSACASPAPASIPPTQAPAAKVDQAPVAPKPPAPAPTAALAAAAAPATAPAAPAAQAGQPKRGGTLRSLGTNLPGTLDPLFFGSPMELTYAWPAYNALVENDPLDVNKLGPGLADSWTVSSDGNTYTFKLHPGIKFHNGQPFTSVDVKYTYETIMKPPAGKVSQRKSAFNAVDSITAPDDLTVVVKTKYPTAAFMAGIASIPIVPKQLHEKGPFVDTAVGTGPFKFVSYQKDVEIVYRRNDDYWRKGLPYLDEVRMLLMTDSSARLQAMRTGRAELYMGPDDAATKTLKQQPDIAVDLYPRINPTYLNFNHSRKDKPWADKRVRQAISLAIDRQDYINTVEGGLGEIIGMIPNVGGWALPADEWQKYPGYSGDKASKIAQAKKLLADAGYSNGLKATAVSRTGYLGDMSLFIQAALKPIGITLDLTSVDEPTGFKMRTEANFDMMANNVPTSLEDPDELLAPFVTGLGVNFGRYSNPRVDDMYKEQSQTVDPAKRKQIVSEIQRILLDDMTYVALTNRVTPVAEAKYVKDHRFVPSFHFHFARSLERVWLDK